MRRRARRSGMPEELSLAIGLIWGHLSAHQFDEAFVLARGCLRVWPDEQHLRLMFAYAKVELLEPLDDDALSLLKEAACQDWARIVLRRSEIHCDISDYEGAALA